MMGVHRWKRLVCACTLATSRSATPSGECRGKKLAGSWYPELQQLRTKGLQATAALWPPLEHAYCFLDQAKAILANESQGTEQQVRERYLTLLAQMRGNLPTLGPLAEAFEH